MIAELRIRRLGGEVDFLGKSHLVKKSGGRNPAKMRYHEKGAPDMERLSI